TLIQDILASFDANGDGLLTLDEVVNADLLRTARRLLPTVGFSAPGRVDTNRRTVQEILSMLHDDLSADMALGIAGEQPVGVPLTQLSGDVCGFLRQLSGGGSGLPAP